MDSLTGAAIAAAVAWLSILLAAVLPIPAFAFQRLRWVGGGAIGLVALAVVGVPVPGYLPPVTLGAGAAAALAWPHKPMATAESLRPS
ncbi:MAG: hypothetical protein AABY18_05515 [Candidatus Thermoplasmatota archaeon]